MHEINNNSVIEPPSVQALSLTPTGNHEGRSITEADEQEKQKLSLQDLDSDTLSMIFCHLKLRDIRSLQKVCTRLRDTIKENNALEKAWYRQFSSAQQNQLRMTISAKDKNQRREWLESFSNNKALVESLLDLQPTNIYLPALLFFARTELMSKCKTFELVTKATIDKTHEINPAISLQNPNANASLNKVKSAALSADGCYLATTNGDHRAKIYRQNPDKTWELETSFPHESNFQPAIFSPNSHHLVTVNRHCAAKIYNLGCDQSWEPKTTIVHNGYIRSATFSTDSQHLVTSSLDGKVKILSKKGEGSWKLSASFFYKNAIYSANFSTDGCYVVAAGKDKTLKIIGQKDAESWEEKDAIPHDGSIISATFSANGGSVVIVSPDRKAVIYEKKADGSWAKSGIIQHGDFINSTSFSPDGRHLVTASNDCKVKIYGKTANGFWKEKGTFFHKGRVFSATFSPDGRHLVTTASYETIR
ncbi:F-box/WD repeat-containing protein [Endozoicomonas sp. ALC066]|uniref:F-box/WD repeat-containing protein n=1 Tax=Endozoicomonas sp. ALC066 TaxID=3403078 RepID=UPI003BB4CBA6